MARFVLRKLILQTHIRSHPVGLDVWILVGPFVYFHTSCVRTAKALARLRGCAGSPEPSLVAYVINIIISWVGSNHSVQMAPTRRKTDNDIHTYKIYKQVNRKTTSSLFPQGVITVLKLTSQKWYQYVKQDTNEPSQDKTNTMAEFSVCAQRVSKDPSFLHSDSEDSDKTGRILRLIWIFAGCTCHFVGFVMRWLRCEDAP